jgi:HEPN superfamily RiboL-PSP-like protein
MAAHTAKSLFELNIQSAKDCLRLFDGLSKLKVKTNVKWLLRAAVVFAVSALDTYFHDKVKYRVGRFSLNDLPVQLAKFEVPIRELTTWDDAQRKGNVLRNWVMDHLAVRPLQSPSAIAEALKLCGIESLWDRIAPNPIHRRELLDKFDAMVKRRNQISHEGDREQSRRSGKRLRPINRKMVKAWIDYVEDLVAKVEAAFPH